MAAFGSLKLSDISAPSLTPEAIEKRRALAQALLEKGNDYSPVQHWTQGMARVAESIMGGLEGRWADQSEAEQRAANDALVMGSPSSGGDSVSPASSPTASNVEAVPSSPAAKTAPAEFNSQLQAAGVDPSDPMMPYYVGMAGKESSFNPSAVSPTGAKGYFQFTQGTGKQFGQYGPNGEDMRADPTTNIKGMIALTKANAEGLAKALGRQPTMGELALAHQQGLGGALDLLSGKSAAPGNLAVNGVDPHSDPRAAAQKIMAFYGFNDQPASQQPPPGMVAQGVSPPVPAVDPTQPVPPAGATAMAGASDAPQPMPNPPAAPLAAPVPDGSTSLPQGMTPGASSVANAVAGPVPTGPGPAPAPAPALPPGAQQVAQAKTLADVMQSNPQVARAMKALNSGFLSPGARIAAQNIVSQALKQIDPATQLEMQKTKLDIEKAQNDIAQAPLDKEEKMQRIDQLRAENGLAPLKRDQLEAQIDLARAQTSDVGKTPAINEAEYIKLHPEAAQNIIKLKRASAATQEGAFSSKSGTILAEGYGAARDAGIKAGTVLPDVDALEELSKSAPQGPIVGRLAERFRGFSNTAAAFQSAVNRVIPALRVPGVGAQSDIELDNILQGLPKLTNNPEGNQAVAAMMREKFKINQEMGRLASQALRHPDDQDLQESIDAQMTALSQKSIMTPKVRDLLGIPDPNAPAAPASGAKLIPMNDAIKAHVSGLTDPAAKKAALEKLQANGFDTSGM